MRSLALGLVVVVMTMLLVSPAPVAVLVLYVPAGYTATEIVDSVYRGPNAFKRCEQDMLAAYTATGADELISARCIAPRAR